MEPTLVSIPSCLAGLSVIMARGSVSLSPPYLTALPASLPDVILVSGRDNIVPGGQGFSVDQESEWNVDHRVSRPCLTHRTRRRHENGCAQRHRKKSHNHIP